MYISGMTKKNRLIIWAAGLVFLLLIFLSPGKVQASVEKNDVDIVYGEEYVFVKKGDNDMLFFAFTGEGKTPKAYSQVLPGAVTSHLFEGDEEASEAFVIDLSALNASKANLLYLCYNETDTPLSIKIPAQKKLKAEYRGAEENDGEYAALYSGYTGITLETGFFKFTADEKAVTDISSIEWRAGTGTNFRAMSEMNLEMYLASSATIYFRYNDGATPISKLSKVKLKKIAKAPSVKMDGAKGTIGIKSNMQYRVVNDGMAGSWISVNDGISSLKLSEIDGLSGDGLYTPFDDTVIQVRVAATVKAHASYVTDLYLDAVDLPEFGSSGIAMSYKNGKDDKGGLEFKNNSSAEYQIAIVEKNAWDTKGTKDLILKIDPSAKKSETGHVDWKKVAAGKTVKIDAKAYKDYTSYVVLVRRSSVKENTKTAEREFRFTSVIRPYGGMIPSPDPAGGTYYIDGDTDITVTFAKEEGLTLYTSFGDGEFAKNTEYKITFSVNAGSEAVISAYFEDDSSGTRGEVVKFKYRYVTNGELDAYKDKWGYNYCKSLDRKFGGNNYTLLYQRIYLGFLTYQNIVDYSDLTVSKEYFGRIISHVWTDNPELIQIQTGCTYNGYTMKLNIRNKTTCDTLLEECEESYAKIVAKIKETYGDSATNIQKVKVIHDWLVRNKEYHSSAFDQTMAGSLSKQYTPVCMSYTLAMKWCCDRLGIQCEIVIGDAGETHAWNLINYDQPVDYSAEEPSIDPTTWYEMDVTWDDPTNMGEDYVGYTYFNVTTEFMKKSRTRGTLLTYPLDNCTGTEYSYGNCVSNNLFDP